jgi:hypothetical protein
MKAIISRIWEWIGANERTLLVVFSVAAGLYALFEYRTNANSARAIETGKFVQLYTSAPMLSARLDLDIIMRSPEIRSSNVNTYSDILKSKDGDEKLIRSVFTHLGFFDELSICVENNVCAQELSCQYFFNDAQTFIENVRPIINDISEREQVSVDVLLRRFAHDHCSTRFRNYCSTVRSSDCTVFRVSDITLGLSDAA